MLYLIATPIGNLKDITLRAIETLKQSDFIIAENPRNSLKLLKHYEIPSKKIFQFAEHNEQRILPTLIANLKSQSGALITDAGTPGISDPGFRLVRACVKEDIKVVPIPGPSSVITALSASGLPTDRFLFLGFLPRTSGKITKLLELVKETESTGIFFESPHRINKTLKLIAEKYPQAKVVVARELTKTYEELIHGIQEVPARGEITLLISFKEF